MTAAPAPSGEGAVEARPTVSLGVVVAPGLTHDITPETAAELAEDLRRSPPSVDWHADLVVDRLVEPPAPTSDIFEAARAMLLERDWDLGIVITDLPLRRARRPVSHHLIPTYGIAIVCLPALGAIHVRRRLRRTLADLVDELAGDDKGEALLELATDTAERPGWMRVLFVPIVFVANLRLLFGMVRANRPWRFAARLYRALVAAVAAGAYGVVVADIWRLSSAMGAWRLAATSLLSIALTIVLVIAAHGLWERAPDSRVREQVILFNVATAATVTIGVLTLYLALLGLILAGAGLVIAPGLLSATLDEPVGFGDYAMLAWFVASLATVGGALGAALESDEAVREAAYAYVPSTTAMRR